MKAGRRFEKQSDLGSGNKIHPMFPATLRVQQLNIQEELQTGNTSSPVNSWENGFLPTLKALCERLKIVIREGGTIENEYYSHAGMLGVLIRGIVKGGFDIYDLVNKDEDSLIKEIGDGDINKGLELYTKSFGKTRELAQKIMGMLNRENLIPIIWNRSGMLTSHEIRCKFGVDYRALNRRIVVLFEKEGLESVLELMEYIVTNELVTSGPQLFAKFTYNQLNSVDENHSFHTGQPSANWPTFFQPGVSRPCSNRALPPLTPPTIQFPPIQEGPSIETYLKDMVSGLKQTIPSQNSSESIQLKKGFFPPLPFSDPIAEILGTLLTNDSPG